MCTYSCVTTSCTSGSWNFTHTAFVGTCAGTHTHGPATTRDSGQCRLGHVCLFSVIFLAWTRSVTQTAWALFLSKHKISLSRLFTFPLWVWFSKQRLCRSLRLSRPSDSTTIVFCCWCCWLLTRVVLILHLMTGGRRSQANRTGPYSGF